MGIAVRGKLLTVVALLSAAFCVSGAAAQAPASLPDAPSAMLMGSMSQPVDFAARVPRPASSSSAEPALAVVSTPDAQTAKGQTAPAASANASAQPVVVDCPTGLLANFSFLSQKQRAVCQQQDPIQFIVEPGPIKPLTPRQKAILAGRGVIEPFNLITIVASSGISVAANAHNAYGPGLKGWGRQTGYSLAEDVQGEATGTWIIPVLVHEDPRYHRLPGHPVSQRIWHAIGHTVLSQHDDGRIMPNYATLINYPLSAVIDDTYVLGISTSVSSTAKRVAVGYATDPVGAIVAEFLPDVAKRIHIHIVFVQQILNKIATGTPGQ
jgi:hypothetical protein